MITPDHTSDPQAFSGDDRLRDAYDFLSAPPEEVPPPPDHLWAGVEARLRPVPVGAWVRVGRPALLGALGVVLGVLLMWIGQHDGPIATRQHVRAVPQVPAKAFGMDRAMAQVPAKAFGMDRAMAQVPAAILPARALAPQSVAIALPVPSARITSATVPQALAGLVLTEQTYAAVPADTARPFRERRRAALLAQRAELAKLRWRTDSLLLATSSTDFQSVNARTAGLPADTLRDADRMAALLPRWSVALAFAPERNFFGLNSPTTDTLSALRRTHETGRAGYNASVTAEYRLNSRLSVGAGLGLTSYGAELRLTDRRTLVTVAYDTQTTHLTQQHLDFYDTYSIRIVQDPVLSPLFNQNFQIIGYDTVFVPRPDTVRTHVELTNTTTTNTTTTAPTVTTREEVSTRILRPNYRFLTVPLLVRYRFGPEGGTWRDVPGGPTATRWWADVALGAQAQLFLGGTQLASPDGRTWRTERVGPGGGPFRPVTVALTGALTLNYALTPRLSASVAPTVRYQTESVYKASTGLTQRPAATGMQLGLRVCF